MSNLKSIRAVSDSPMVNMGPIRLRQPIPNREMENVDPFILLHHYGPYAISEFNNPFDLGPHPHRGFEPITLLYKGAQLHRDSLGVCSQIKMNFFAQNLREVSANLVKNFDTVFF